MKPPTETKTRNLKLNEVRIGDWIQVWNPVIKRYMPPTRIVALFDDGTVYHVISDDQGDPFEDDIRNVYALPVSEDILLGFGFELVNHTNELTGRTSDVKELRYKGVRLGTLFTILGCVVRIDNLYFRYIHDLVYFFTLRYYDMELEWKGVDKSNTNDED